MLRGVLQALKCLFIRAMFFVIATGASPGQTKQELQEAQLSRAMPLVVEYFGQSLKAALSRKINMVTFANLGSVRLPSLKFVGLRVRKIRRISCLSTTVSQLFEPLQKIVIFTYTPAFVFCLPWGRSCVNHAKRCMNK